MSSFLFHGERIKYFSKHNRCCFKHKLIVKSAANQVTEAATTKLVNIACGCGARCLSHERRCCGYALVYMCVILACILLLACR